MKAFEGYTYLDGGICAAKGFQASGTYCGIKKAMAPDLSLIHISEPTRPY